MGRGKEFCENYKNSRKISKKGRKNDAFCRNRCEIVGIWGILALRIALKTKKNKKLKSKELKGRSHLKKRKTKGYER